MRSSEVVRVYALAAHGLLPAQSTGEGVFFPGQAEPQLLQFSTLHICLASTFYEFISVEDIGTAVQTQTATFKNDPVTQYFDQARVRTTYRCSPCAVCI